MGTENAKTPTGKKKISPLKYRQTTTQAFEQIFNYVAMYHLSISYNPAM